MDARQKINKRRQQAGRGGKAGRGRGGKLAGRVGSRGDVPRVKSNVRAGKTLSKAKATVKREGKTLKVTRAVNDLRQLIGKKPNVAGKQTAIKKRLGLQSRSAREAKVRSYLDDGRN